MPVDWLDDDWNEANHPKWGVIPNKAAHLWVETPIGEIFARKSGDPAYPGICLDLRRVGSNGEMPLVLVEFDDTTKKIVTRVWGDSQVEDYTVKVEHENVDEFFDVED